MRSQQQRSIGPSKIRSTTVSAGRSTARNSPLSTDSAHGVMDHSCAPVQPVFLMPLQLLLLLLSSSRRFTNGQSDPPPPAVRSYTPTNSYSQFLAGFHHFFVLFENSKFYTWFFYGTFRADDDGKPPCLLSLVGIVVKVGAKYVGRSPTLKQR